MQPLEFVPGTQVLVIEDQPHPLEERLKALSDDGNKAGIMGMFVGLYESGRQDEIDYILSRQLFTSEEKAKAVEKIAAAVMKVLPELEETE